MRGTRVFRTAIVVGSAMAWSVSASAQSPANRESAKVAVRANAVKVNTAALQGFSVVLVLGDLQGEGKEDDVPAAARRALRDMRDFLPYKSYRLLDTAWILGNSGTRASTRLRGSDKQEYDLNLAGEVVSQGETATTTLKMTFQLSDGSVDVRPQARPGGLRPDTDATRAQLADMESRRTELVERLRAVRERSGVQDGQRQGQGQGQGQSQLAQDLEKQLTMLNLQLSMNRNRLNAAYTAAMRKLIDTSFNMDIGETVVVGTSRLGSGDKALIALLTAVPRGKP